MPHKNRNPHACCGDFYFRINNLLGFGNHFPFFFGGAIFHKHINMRNDVKGDLFWIDFWRHFLARHIHTFGLVPQLVNRVFAAARNWLVGADHHALDGSTIMKRFERNHHLRGWTIGVGDYIFLRISKDCIRVYLRYDQRDIGIIPI